MRAEPRAGLREQLLDLIVADPVVLVSIERRDEHIEMRERVGDRVSTAQRERHVARGAGDLIDRHLPAQRGEERADHVRAAGKGVTRISSGIAERASSGRSRDSPVIAVRKARLSATDRNDDAA
jgi:hypothetical protein